MPVCSAFATIVRNLTIRNRLPRNPTRSCENRIGPGKSKTMAMAITTNRGNKTLSPAAARTKSNARLTASWSLSGKCVAPLLQIPTLA